MRWFGSMAAAAGLLLASAGLTVGAPILQDDFTAPPPGMKGGEIVDTGRGRAYRGPGGRSQDAGSYVEYELKGMGFRPEEGTIELDVTRGEIQSPEALFSFADETGERVFTFYVDWIGMDRSGETVQLRPVSKGRWYWQTPDRDKFGNRMFRQGAFVAGFPKGRTAHLAMTWGPAGIALYLDGQALEGEPHDQAGLIAALRQATRLILGGQISTKIPGGAWSMTRSPLGNLQLSDRQLAVGDLGRAIPPKGLHVYGVEHGAGQSAGLSGKLVAGSTLTVTVTGTPGATGSFDVAHYPDIDRRIPLDWRGWGVYLEEKTFFEEDEVDLGEVEGYRVYVQESPFDPLTTQAAPLAELDVKAQTYTAENLTIDAPYYVAVVAVKRDGTLRPVISPIAGEPLAETAPGVYTGSLRFGYQHRYPRAVAVGRLRTGDRVEELAADAAFTVDPALTIAVTTEPDVLKADEQSRSTVTVTVTDANGSAVPGHEIRFLLATTSQYTGVVGGGAFTDQVGGAIKTDLRGATDLFGRLKATYVAGFAAKTAVIVARDMAANSTGAGYVRTFIQATAQLELEPPRQTEAMAAGYAIEVISSDSWLTADGKSRARITARVTQAGKPVEGHQVAFRVAAGAGELRTVQGATGRDGEARAVYTAGKKIGVVLITATDTTVDISGSVQIELRSDAPAKIAIATDPARLPADGRSRATLSVLVTDINDNPNDNVEVEYAIVEGKGSLAEKTSLTDRRGETANTFTAGRTPGRVSIELTVRSPAPTAEELGGAQGLALAVPDYRFR